MIIIIIIIIMFDSTNVRASNSFRQFLMCDKYRLRVFIVEQAFAVVPFSFFEMTH